MSDIPITQKIPRVLRILSGTRVTPHTNRNQGQRMNIYFLLFHRGLKVINVMPVRKPSCAIVIFYNYLLAGKKMNQLIFLMAKTKASIKRD